MAISVFSSDIVCAIPAGHIEGGAGHHSSCIRSKEYHYRGHLRRIDPRNTERRLPLQNLLRSLFISFYIACRYATCDLESLLVAFFMSSQRCINKTRHQAVTVMPCFPSSIAADFISPIMPHLE